MTDLHVNPQQRGGHPGPPPVEWSRPGYQGVVLTLGDLLVTPDSVLLPQGRFPLAGTTWTVQDATTIVRTRPKRTHVLSLSFLRRKESHYDGFVRVTVVGEGLYHTVTFPPGPESTTGVAGLVNQARALAAAAASTASDA